MLAALSGLVLTGCNRPDISAELQSFDKAVTATAKDYRAAFNINPATQRESLINTAVANRSVPIDLTEGCVGSAVREPGEGPCDIDFSGLGRADLTLGTADRQWVLISDYIKALSGLANAKTDRQISGASISLIAALNRMGKARGRSSLFSTLSENKTGIAKVASFAAKQYQARLLREAITDGHKPLERLLLNLRDIAAAKGATTRQQAFDTLEEFADRADDMRLDGTAAQYRDALRDLYQARDAYRAYDQSALIPRLDRLVRVHAVLRDQVRRDATPDEIADLLRDLKELEQSF